MTVNKTPVTKSEEKPSVKETQEVTATEAEETNDADEEDQDEDQEEDHSDHEDEEEDNFNKLSAEQLISEYRKIFKINEEIKTAESYGLLRYRPNEKYNLHYE